MVGKHVVDAADVDIDCLAEQAHGHGGAFDMPAGPPFAKGALPKDLPVSLIVVGFPEDEIGRHFLCHIHRFRLGERLPPSAHPY